ncbi:hypothetical protein K470DRAFT_260872 [Piedraia hortae CBS 480.64]|uniref:PH domain-containing protein n=1 Tax=Piedraia hortae CBS 480.64 TaxID=1314780 RepID=A0A6A7BQ79_9PEZI|nr:hypothetical protein K470DRAFT_260872 [Piedraia hortae CBS 480.64]
MAFSLPHRSTSGSNDTAVADEDSGSVSKLLVERLLAWRHVSLTLEDYVSGIEKAHSAHGHSYEKALKALSHPLREGENFDQRLGGIAGLFDNLRSNTQGQVNSHYETAKTLHGTVLPIFTRLTSEIKSKEKEISKGSGKSAKVVDKARASTQKYIELLGQHAAGIDSRGGTVKPSEDPYVLQRHVYNRLHKQVQEENNSRGDLLSVQNGFAQFEAHVLETIKTGLSQFTQAVNKQSEMCIGMHNDSLAVAQRIPPDFEWNGFVQRNNTLLIDPNAPKRSVSSISFPNQNHRSTQPILAGTLEKRGKLMSRSENGYFVITPAKYLHQFESEDDYSKDPSPQMSLYLPDCTVGELNGMNFNIKGKDVAGHMGALSMAHEYPLKAHSPEGAMKWYEVICEMAKHPSGVGGKAAAAAGAAGAGGLLSMGHHGQHQQQQQQQAMGQQTGLMQPQQAQQTVGQQPMMQQGMGQQGMGQQPMSTMGQGQTGMPASSMAQSSMSPTMNQGGMSSTMTQGMPSTVSQGEMPSTMTQGGMPASSMAQGSMPSSMTQNASSMGQSGAVPGSGMLQGQAMQPGQMGNMAQNIPK